MDSSFQWLSGEIIAELQIQRYILEVSWVLAVVQVGTDKIKVLYGKVFTLVRARVLHS